MQKDGDTIGRRYRAEDGFSLVEGLVVVVILGTVVALGILTMVRAPAALSDAVAKTQARRALVTQKTFFSDRGLWGRASEMQDLEPSVHFAELGSDGPEMMGKVYVKVDVDVATLVSRSETGNCYWARTAPTGTTFATVPCAVFPGDNDYGTSW